MGGFFGVCFYFLKSFDYFSFPHLDLLVGAKSADFKVVLLFSLEGQGKYLFFFFHPRQTRTTSSI